MTRAAALAAVIGIGWALGQRHARRPIRRRLEQLGQTPVPAPSLYLDQNAHPMHDSAWWASRHLVHRATHGAWPENTP